MILNIYLYFEKSIRIFSKNLINFITLNVYIYIYSYNIVIHIHAPTTFPQNVGWLVYIITHYSETFNFVKIDSSLRSIRGIELSLPTSLIFSVERAYKVLNVKWEAKLHLLVCPFPAFLYSLQN